MVRFVLWRAMLMPSFFFRNFDRNLDKKFRREFSGWWVNRHGDSRRQATIADKPTDEVPN